MKRPSVAILRPQLVERALRIEAQLTKPPFQVPFTGGSVAPPDSMKFFALTFTIKAFDHARRKKPLRPRLLCSRKCPWR